MSEQKRKPFQIFLEEEEHAALKLAAKKDKRPMSQFIVISSLERAGRMGFAVKE